MSSRILCINCGIRMYHLKRRPVLEQDTRMVSYIAERISPRIIEASDNICQACEDAVMMRITQVNNDNQSSGSPIVGHSKVCLMCGRSVLRKKSYLIFRDNPSEIQQMITTCIINSIPSEEVTKHDRVCVPCWLRARRKVLRIQAVQTVNVVVQRPEVSVTSGSGNTSPQRDAAVAQAAETTDDEETRDESPGPEPSDTSGNGDTSPQRDATVAHAAETTVEDQIKAFIARVFHYLEQEFETIKNMDAATVLRHLARLPHRTARATGVSEATVLAIIGEEATRNAAERARREGEAQASAIGNAKTRKRHRVRKKQCLAESASEVSDGSVDEARPSQASVPQDTTIAPAAELLVMKTEPFEYYNEEPAINIVPANETAINKEQVQKDPISIDVKLEAPAASDDEMTDTNETSPAKPATSKRRRISRQSDRSDHTYTHDQERIDSDPLSSNVKVEAPDEEMNESHMLRVRLKAERENDEEGFS